MPKQEEDALHSRDELLNTYTLAQLGSAFVELTRDRLLIAEYFPLRLRLFVFVGLLMRLRSFNCWSGHQHCIQHPLARLIHKHFLLNNKQC